MKKAILATKVGMTQIFDENGVLIPVTVLQAGPCAVTQVKTVENDGYSAVQVGYGEAKDKIVAKDVAGKKTIVNAHGVKKAQKGHFEKAKALVLLAVDKKESRGQAADGPYRLDFEPDTNEFYYFRHEYYLPMLQERLNKNPAFQLELREKYASMLEAEITKKKYDKYETEDAKKAAAKTPVLNAIANSYYKNTKFSDKPATYFFSGPRTLALFRFMYAIIFALLIYIAILPLFI